MPNFIGSDRHYSAIEGGKDMENLIISIDFDKGTFPKSTPVTGRISPLLSTSTGFIQSNLAITIEDRVGPSENFCHWLIWNIKARDTIPETFPGIR